jgi:hypothetical protein
MNPLKSHIEKILNQDFILKYPLINLLELPEFESISFSIKFNKASKLSGCIFFRILSFNMPYITQSRTNILSLNIRKGDPVGGKLILRKKDNLNFLNFFVFEFLPSIKNFDGLKINSSCIHWQIKDIFCLDTTNSLYGFAKGLSSLSLVIKGKNLKKNFIIACRFPVAKK